MILKRIKRTTYIPKKKQYCELYSVKIKELGYFDPIDQIAEDLRLPIGEAKKSFPPSWVDMRRPC